MSDERQTTALFSEGREYRYRLERRWGPGPSVNFLMLNPSTADEIVNDPTVERCERRTKEWGYNALIVTNLFAFRATDPKDLFRQSKPVGPANDANILGAAMSSVMVVCAWGNHGARLSRAWEVKRMLRNAGIDLWALRIAKSGEPCHPLYLPYALWPFKWNPWAALSGSNV